MFIANPFGFTKQLLGQNRDGDLDCSKEEIDLHLRYTYSDPSRQEDLGKCDILVDPPPPMKDFDTREPCLKEVQEVVKKTRASSAPGPSGFPYKVYKNCPLLLKRLWIISLLSVEGKIFSIVERRLADFLSSNNYIDTSVQKGGISGVVTQLIQEARENK